MKKSVQTNVEGNIFLLPEKLLKNIKMHETRFKKRSIFCHHPSIQKLRDLEEIRNICKIFFII